MTPTSDQSMKRIMYDFQCHFQPMIMMATEDIYIKQEAGNGKYLGAHHQVMSSLYSPLEEKELWIYM